MTLFRRAERRKAFLKIAMCGVSGSGKTYSALCLAQGMGSKIAMVDTENGSGEMYSDLCEYDVAALEPPFTPEKYINAIREAEAAGYDVLIIDSLSHAWSGQGGILEMVDKKAASSRSGNSYTAWRDVTPKHNQLVDAILQSKLDVIVTMRSKTAYEMQDNEKGKKTPVKIGLAPIQRDGVEYEFTIVFDIAVERHIASTSKDRTGLFNEFCDVITSEVGKRIKEWANGGADAPIKPAETQAQTISFVRIEDGDVKVLTKKEGYKSIYELPMEMLEKIGTHPNYVEAHEAIKAVLAADRAEEPKGILDGVKVDF